MRDRFGILAAGGPHGGEGPVPEARRVVEAVERIEELGLGRLVAGVPGLGLGGLPLAARLVSIEGGLHLGPLGPEAGGVALEGVEALQVAPEVGVGLAACLHPGLGLAHRRHRGGLVVGLLGPLVGDAHQREAGLPGVRREQGVQVGEPGRVEVGAGGVVGRALQVQATLRGRRQEVVPRRGQRLALVAVLELLARLAQGLVVLAQRGLELGLAGIRILQIAVHGGQVLLLLALLPGADRGVAGRAHLEGRLGEGLEEEALEVPVQVGPGEPLAVAEALEELEVGRLADQATEDIVAVLQGEVLHEGPGARIPELLVLHGLEGRAELVHAGQLAHQLVEAQGGHVLDAAEGRLLQEGLEEGAVPLLEELGGLDQRVQEAAGDPLHGLFHRLLHEGLEGLGGGPLGGLGPQLAGQLRHHGAHGVHHGTRHGLEGPRAPGSGHQALHRGHGDVGADLLDRGARPLDGPLHRRGRERHAGVGREHGGEGRQGDRAGRAARHHRRHHGADHGHGGGDVVGHRVAHRPVVLRRLLLILVEILEHPLAAGIDEVALGVEQGLELGGLQVEGGGGAGEAGLLHEVHQRVADDGVEEPARPAGPALELPAHPRPLEEVPGGLGLAHQLELGLEALGAGHVAGHPVLEGLVDAEHLARELAEPDREGLPLGLGHLRDLVDDLVDLGRVGPDAVHGPEQGHRVVLLPGLGDPAEVVVLDAAGLLGEHVAEGVPAPRVGVGVLGVEARDHVLVVLLGAAAEPLGPGEQRLLEQLLVGAEAEARQHIAPGGPLEAVGVGQDLVPRQLGLDDPVGVGVVLQGLDSRDPGDGAQGPEDRARGRGHEGEGPAPEALVLQAGLQLLVDLVLEVEARIPPEVGVVVRLHLAVLFGGELAHLREDGAGVGAPGLPELPRGPATVHGHLDLDGGDLVGGALGLAGAGVDAGEGVEEHGLGVAQTLLGLAEEGAEVVVPDQRRPLLDGHVLEGVEQELLVLGAVPGVEVVQDEVLDPSGAEVGVEHVLGVLQGLAGELVRQEVVEGLAVLALELHPQEPDLVDGHGRDGLLELLVVVEDARAPLLGGPDLVGLLAGLLLLLLRLLLELGPGLRVAHQVGQGLLAEVGRRGEAELGVLLQLPDALGDHRLAGALQDALVAFLVARVGEQALHRLERRLGPHLHGPIAEARGGEGAEGARTLRLGGPVGAPGQEEERPPRDHQGGEVRRDRARDEVAGGHGGVGHGLADLGLEAPDPPGGLEVGLQAGPLLGRRFQDGEDGLVADVLALLGVEHRLEGRLPVLEVELVVRDPLTLLGQVPVVLAGLVEGPETGLEIALDRGIHVGVADVVREPLARLLAQAGVHRRQDLRPIGELVHDRLEVRALGAELAQLALDPLLGGLHLVSEATHVQEGAALELGDGGVGGVLGQALLDELLAQGLLAVVRDGPGHLDLEEQILLVGGHVLRGDALELQGLGGVHGLLDLTHGDEEAVALGGPEPGLVVGLEEGLAVARHAGVGVAVAELEHEAAEGLGVAAGQVEGLVQLGLVPGLERPLQVGVLLLDLMASLALLAVLGGLLDGDDAELGQGEAVGGGQAAQRLDPLGG